MKHSDSWMFVAFAACGKLIFEAWYLGKAYLIKKMDIPVFMEQPIDLVEK